MAGYSESEVEQTSAMAQRAERRSDAAVRAGGPHEAQRWLSREPHAPARMAAVSNALHPRLLAHGTQSAATSARASRPHPQQEAMEHGLHRKSNAHVVGLHCMPVNVDFRVLGGWASEK
jgi:hypothetical protein